MCSRITLILWQLLPGPLPSGHEMHSVTKGSLPWVQLMELSPMRSSIWVHSLCTAGCGEKVVAVFVTGQLLQSTPEGGVTEVPVTKSLGPD